jgi:hypothetical protein
LKHSIYFLLFALCSLYSSAQTYVKSDLHSNISIDVDSIFVKFVYPAIPDEMKYLSFGKSNFVLHDLQIGVYILVDTNLQVQHIDFFPLVGLGNDIPADHHLWDEIKKSILDASKNWIFKPIKWKLLDDWEKQANQNSILLRNINLLKKVKPFNGKQRHFVVFSFNYEFEPDDFNFLYLIRVDH